jgi:hypothetical protein
MGIYAKQLRASCVFVFFATLLTSRAVLGLAISEAEFLAGGGSFANIPGTIHNAYSASRERSLDDQFCGVGTLGGCTATWIGTNEASNKTYFLTAAHCINVSGLATNVGAVTFRDASGTPHTFTQGVFHIPQERVNWLANQSVHWNYRDSSDIAIYELAGLYTPEGARAFPILNDSATSEVGLVVDLMGYGFWGVTRAGVGASDSYQPFLNRRAHGTNRITNVMNVPKGGLLAYVEQPGNQHHTPFEAAIAPGDSGSAWWATVGGSPTIVGVTSGSNGHVIGSEMTAASVLDYSSWILSIFPGASVASQYADFNSNGVVDAADYVVWRNGLGSGYAQSDYTRWRRLFGAPATGWIADGSQLTGAVPEPSAPGLLAAVLLFSPVLSARRATWLQMRRYRQSV